MYFQVKNILKSNHYTISPNSLGFKTEFIKNMYLNF
jgi:hypothetical protein